MKKKIIFTLFMIVLFGSAAAAGYSYVKYGRHLDTYVKAPTQEEVKASDIEKRMDDVKTRSDFKTTVQKFVENESRRIATDEYEKAEAAKYAAIQKDIQVSKDIVKKNELSF